MTKHKCITDLSSNFYKATQDLADNDPLVVTSRGKPVMTIFKGDHSVGAMVQQSQVTSNSISYSAESISAFNSQGIPSRNAEATLEEIMKLLGVSTQALESQEVKEDEKEPHSHK